MSRTFQLHGSTFTSYVAPASGSTELCAWRLDVAPGSIGVPHRVSREEVVLVTAGELEVDIDGSVRSVATGEVVLVPAGVWFAVSGGPDGASAWVTTSVGLTATLRDGETITPPWTT